MVNPSRCRTLELAARWVFMNLMHAHKPLFFLQYDYLQRDAHNCGVKVSCDFSRLIQFSKVRELFIPLCFDLSHLCVCVRMWMPLCVGVVVGVGVGAYACVCVCERVYACVYACVGVRAGVGVCGCV